MENKNARSLKRETVSRFLKGFTAGMITALCVQPLSVIKTSMQISPITKDATISTKNLKFMQATKTIFNNEGVRGFARGFVPSIMRSSLILGTYHANLYYFETIFKQLPLSPPVIASLASACARSLQTVLTNPLTVI